ncbi:MAG: hypothetical protein OXE94_08075, partial [Aestuariivita sp.]|nr:hypothetical protein [Aestuariivita sp.]
MAEHFRVLADTHMAGVGLLDPGPDLVSDALRHDEAAPCPLIIFLLHKSLFPRAQIILTNRPLQRLSAHTQPKIPVPHHLMIRWNFILAVKIPSPSCHQQHCV